MKIKMKDVAKRAGVSVATVSYVINGTRNVREETRKKVEQAIADLNYSPDVSAQKLKSGQSRLIGLITPKCSGSSTSILIETCEKRLAQDGYQMLIINTAFKPEVERNALHILSSGIVDGIILVSLCGSSYELQKELPPNFPCVLANCAYPDCPVDSIGFTTYRAMQDVVDYIEGKGLEQISLFSGPAYLSSSQEHEESLKHALAARGLTFDPEYLVYTKRTEQRTQAETRRLMEKGCRAFLFADFTMMQDTFQDLETGSFSIPPGCEVITFCESLSDRKSFKWIPKIQCPTEELGRLACERLLTRIKGDRGPVQRTLLDSVFEEAANPEGNN